MDHNDDLVSLEKRFAQNSYIAHSCIINNAGTKSIVLINLSDVAKGRDRTDIEKSLRKTLGSVNRQIMNMEPITSIVIAHAVWTKENGLLDLNGLPQRQAIESKYQALIEKSLTASDKILW